MKRKKVERTQMQGSRYADLKRFVSDRPGHDYRYAIDASRAKQALGWQPETSFEAGLARTVAWYLENDAWRRSVEAEGDLRRRQGLAPTSPRPTRASGDGAAAR